MPEVALELPELEDVDEDAPAFKRRLALLVVLVTFVGSVVAYLQTQASNQEDDAAREAQRFAVTGLGEQVDATTGFRFNYRVYVENDLLERRRVIANNQSRRAEPASAEQTRFTLEATRFAAVSQAIAGLTPLVSDEEFTEENDPAFPSAFDAELQVGPDEAQLRQEVEADKANDYGGKADAFVAVLTVLAVSLFLLGLSLTVTGRARFLLVGPGVALALVSVGWAVLIALSDVTQVSEDAVEDAAEGRRLMVRAEALDAGDEREQTFDEAIDALTDAVEDSPDFAAAFGRRADAHFLSGAAPSRTGFVSIADLDAVERAVEDGDRAIALGAGQDINVVGNLGFNLFLVEDFDRSASLSRKALDLNDQLPQIWFNLGVAEVARGDEDAAEEAYEEGMELVEEEPDPFVRSSVLSAARVDLGIARDLISDDDLVDDVEGELAEFEATLNRPADDPEFAGDVGSGGGRVTEVTVQQNLNDPSFMEATATLDGIDVGTPLSYIWYFREDGDAPFDQPVSMKEFRRTENADSDVSFARLGPCLPAGEYRVEVYRGDDRLARGQTTIEVGALGPLSEFEDELEGFRMCVPDDFEQGVLDPDTGGVTFDSLEAGVLIGVSSFPADAVSRAQGTAAVDATILAGAGDAGSASEIEDSTLNAEESPVSAVSALPARTIRFFSAEGFATEITGSLGPDGVMRLVIVIADTEGQLDVVATELLRTLTFERVDPGDG